jgi:hypothetical protein
LLLAALALALGACEEPDQFLPSYIPGGPQGILGGTVTYSGPMPCTAQQHVVGAAVLLAFDTRLLPPPAGLGTTATSLAAVGGDVLFGGIVDRLTFESDGSKWCPPASAPPVTVSADWTLGALPGAVYEVRGFYDYPGTFNPVFSITKLPVKGDIAGGAIDNVAEVLTGSEPVYRQIQLGTLDPTTGDYSIPAEGSNIDGIAVTLALPLPLGLPIFYSSAVTYSTHKCSGTMAVPTTASNCPAPGAPAGTVCDVSMPSDYQLPVFNQFNPAGTEDSLIRLTATAGFPPSEAQTASMSPFNLPVYPKPDEFVFSWQDVNGDGVLNLAGDHAAASPILPALLPLSIFAKLTQSMPAMSSDDLNAQASPAIILQGITIYQNLVETVLWPGMLPMNASWNDPLNSKPYNSVEVGITPAAVCLDPTDFSPDAMAVLVVAHPTDCSGSPLLTDPNGTLRALRAQFGRAVLFANNNEGACLPQGRFGLNLVYGTGQAWSNPNEVGVCAAGETESSDGKTCSATLGSRPRLPSQDTVLTIGPPSDPKYCALPGHGVPPCCLDASKCKCPNGKCPTTP